MTCDGSMYYTIVFELAEVARLFLLQPGNEATIQAGPYSICCVYPQAIPTLPQTSLVKALCLM